MHCDGECGCDSSCSSSLPRWLAFLPLLDSSDLSSLPWFHCGSTHYGTTHCCPPPKLTLLLLLLLLLPLLLVLILLLLRRQAAGKVIVVLQASSAIRCE